MFLWLSALPWSMWPDAHWAVVPITAVVSYLLLGIGEPQGLTVPAAYYSMD
jgi:hypothetical protein